MAGHKANKGWMGIYKFYIFAIEKQPFVLLMRLFIGVCMKLKINPNYQSLNDFITSLPTSFALLSQATTLHQGRNIVKYVEVDGVKLVIKCYSTLSLFNRIIYGRLRKSKSMRAYDNACQLLKLGVITPKPIAAIDCYRRGLLRESFFISEYSDFTSMKIINDPQYEDDVELLNSLSRFIARLHQIGIQHNDLNVANVRYRQGDDGYMFELIDNNRMRFKRRALSERERLNDLRHFSCQTVQFVYVLDRYAQLTGMDKNLFATKGVVSRLAYELGNGFRRKVKNKLHR